MPSPKTPLTRLFVAQIRAGDPSALDRLKQALVRNAGNIEQTAEELSVAFQSIHRWGKEVPAVQAILDEHRRGRIGRGPSRTKEPTAKALAAGSKRKGTRA